MRKGAFEEGKKKGKTRFAFVAYVRLFGVAVSVDNVPVHFSLPVSFVLYADVPRGYMCARK